MMKIIPAMDLLDGNCVRLYQGDFATAKIYTLDSLQLATQWQQQQVQACHIVDLNGAQLGSPQQLNLAVKIKQNTDLFVQLGGGMRDQQSIERALQQGIDRVVIGSLVINQPELMCSLLDRYGAGRFVLALDVRLQPEPMLVKNAWRETTNIGLWELLSRFSAYQGLQVLCTDIERDGSLLGPNVELYQQFIQRFPQFKLQASGGIGSLADCVNCKEVGVAAVIIGKALFENCFSYSQVVAECGLC